MRTTLRKLRENIKARRMLYAALLAMLLSAAVMSRVVFSGDAEAGPTPEPPAAAQTAPPRPAPTPASDVTPAPTPESVPAPEPRDDGVREPDREIDWDWLLGRNPDIIAWIYVPGTNIDYPVVRSADNYEYLRTDFDGNYSLRGTVFMDMGNRAGFVDRVTVLYGHRMNDGTMFSELHSFRDAEFFSNNRELKLYTPEGVRTYTVIAAYITDDRNILYESYFRDDDFWAAYIQSVYAHEDANLYHADIGKHDQILVLSTCVAGRDAERLLVQGLLVRDGR